jgi:hypothetical protein
LDERPCIEKGLADLTVAAKSDERWGSTQGLIERCEESFGSREDAGGMLQSTGQ